MPIDSGETRRFEGGSGQVELVETDRGVVGRATFQPGWRWSQHVKPVAGTESCEVAHAGFVISGAMTVRMDDGTTESFGPGDVQIVGPGHDAWVDGDEPCILLDWQGMADYAKG
ncbi:MAG TPA: cupin domain-containing protein [Mycobacteriales bacterium]|nr:cupin domain-containing protein [Mycobacteriales bacterium]